MLVSLNISTITSFTIFKKLRIRQKEKYEEEIYMGMADQEKDIWRLLSQEKEVKIILNLCKNMIISPKPGMYKLWLNLSAGNT